MSRALKYAAVGFLSLLVFVNSAIGLGGMALIWLCVLAVFVYRTKHV